MAEVAETSHIDLEGPRWGGPPRSARDPPIALSTNKISSETRDQADQGDRPRTRGLPHFP